MCLHCVKKDTIHKVTTMLATSKGVLFPGHEHLLTTGIDDPSPYYRPNEVMTWK